MTSSFSTRQQRAMKPSGESIDILYTFMTQKFKDLDEKVATKDCIDSLHQVMGYQNAKICQLEDKIAALSGTFYSFREDQKTMSSISKENFFRIPSKAFQSIESILDFHVTKIFRLVFEFPFCQ